MSMQSRQLKRKILAVSLVVVFAVLLHFTGREGDTFILDSFTNFLRTFLYISLYTFWMISISQRVVQPSARRLLMLTAALMIFWLVLREIRFRFVADPFLLRQLWYAYYIPMLLIPLLSLYVSLYAGMDESYRLPRAALLPFIPAVLLLLLILTNDLHRMAFAFPSGTVWSESDYSYGPVYYISVIYFGVCAAAGLAVMIHRWRIPDRRNQLFLPILPLLLAACYFTLYALGYQPVRTIGWDLTAASTLFYCAYLEACLSIGLIQTNTLYRELFGAAQTLSVMICDNDYKIRYAASGAVPLSESVMRAAEEAPVTSESSLIVKNAKISGGHAIWTEDVSSLLALQEKLKSLHEELTERGELLRYEYAREAEIQRESEQNRLYDLLQEQTQSQLDRIHVLVRLCGTEKDEQERRRILGTIYVLGCYIKRRRDFILTLEKGEKPGPGSLYNAVKESLHALSFLGVQGSCMVDLPDPLQDPGLVGKAYEIFEAVLEAVLFRANWINVRICEISGVPRLSISTDALCREEDKDPLLAKYPGLICACDEDGTDWTVDLYGAGEAS